jgi:hypothetical protein
MLGEAGNDVLNGNQGNRDQADGGAGSDRCVAEIEISCEN